MYVMNLLKILTLGLLLAMISGCSYLNLDEVVPDKRTEYRDSRDLPPLEVPPDLTSDTINDSMKIPGDETPNTLSAYERQQRDAAGTALGGALENEDSLTLRGDRFTIWPKLKRFWQDRGYTLELDDAELGVIETSWSQSRDTAEGQARDRYKVFAEAGSQANTTVLFISHDLQRRGSAGGEWVDAGSDTERRKAMAAELYNHYGGAQTSEAGGRTASRDSAVESDADAETRSSLPRAEIVNNADGQVYMTLPQAFDKAWPAMEQAINAAGMEPRAANQEDGEYIVAYMPPQRGEDDGWFDALKFWQDDGPLVYRLSLTGTGEATEVMVRDEDGEWQSTDEARELLNRLQRQYNR